MHRNALLLAAAVLLSAAPPARADGDGGRPVTCLYVGAGAVTADALLSVEDGRLLMERDGTPVEMELEACREVILDRAVRSSSPAPWTVWTRSGCRLGVRRIAPGAEPEAFSVSGYGWEAEGLPLGALSAMLSRDAQRNGPAETEAFEDALADPPAGSDRVAVALEGGVQVVSCVAEGVTEAGLALSLGGARRTVRWEDLRWAVLGGAASEASEPPRHRVGLTDGSVVCLESLELRDALLTGADGPARFSIGQRPRGRLNRRDQAASCKKEPARVQVVEPFLIILLDLYGLSGQHQCNNNQQKHEQRNRRYAHN